MNRSDSERISAVLKRAGFDMAKDEYEAEMVVVTACSVRQSAIDRIHGKARNWAKVKKERPLITVLSGCVLEQDKKKFEGVFDIVINKDEISNLPCILEGRFEKENLPFFNISPNYSEPFRAFVPIMTGCNNFCSYCAVPYTRGREASRTAKEVIDELRRLATGGCKEVELLGQNVNSYSPADKGSFSKDNPYSHAFAALLWEANQIDGLERIHFSSAHPKDMDDEVIDALALPKQLNYLHLAMQSGDDGILEKMKRKYTGGDYLDLIDKIKAKRPGIALGTDIIVGFPGETEEQFRSTVEMYKKCDFDISYTAQYSPRSGTAAARLEDDVPKAEKKRRWRVLEKLMIDITSRKNKAYEGKVVSVLVDKYEKGYCFGQSDSMKLTRFEGNEHLIGQIVPVKITEAKEWILYGEKQ